MSHVPRLAARAVIVKDDKLLLVNATPDKGDGKWCVPGGGIDNGENMREALTREVYEETGLRVKIADIIAISEYVDPAKSFHQVDLFFCATITGGELDNTWRDTTNVVSKRGFYTFDQIKNMDVVPAHLKQGYWQQNKKPPVIYRGMEYKDAQ